MKLRLEKRYYRALCQMRGIECDFQINGGSLSTMRVNVSPEERDAIKTLKNGLNVVVKNGIFIVEGDEIKFYSNVEKRVVEIKNEIIVPKIKRLFFDIETTPMLVYSWRIGSKINLSYDNIVDTWKVITICYKWEGEEEVHSLVWDEIHDERQMLQDFIELANEADEMVAHNGDRFDIKKIRTRCIYHGIPAFPKYRSLDTLKKARGNFDFPSNALDAIAKFLGVGAKMTHEGFDMWVKVLNGDDEAQEKIVDYCKHDVVVLEDVYQAMKNYIKPNTHAGVHLLGSEYKYSCPICGEKHLELVKTDVTRKGFISRVVECPECHHVYNISNKSYMMYLKHKLEGNL